MDLDYVTWICQQVSMMIFMMKLMMLYDASQKNSADELLTFANCCEGHILNKGYDHVTTRMAHIFSWSSVKSNANIRYNLLIISIAILATLLFLNCSALPENCKLPEKIAVTVNPILLSHGFRLQVQSEPKGFIYLTTGNLL